VSSVETKEERFARVAGKRVNRVLEALRVLSKCSNRRSYQWNDDQLKKMWSAIEIEYRACKDSFGERKRKDFHFWMAYSRA